MKIDKPKEKAILLFSGGMDSLIAWEYLGRPITLYVDLDHKYAGLELGMQIDMIKNFTPEEQKRFTMFKLGAIGGFELDDATIPGRNMYFAMIAASLGFSDIWIIVQKDETSIPDRTKEFFEKASELLTLLYGREIKVDSPFWTMDKVDMVQWYKDAGYDIDRLHKTWACYHPKKSKIKTGAGQGDVTISPCGNCPACFRRFVALKLNGLKEYNFEEIMQSDVAATYLERAKAGYYSEERNKHILEAMSGSEEERV